MQLFGYRSLHITSVISQYGYKLQIWDDISCCTWWKTVSHRWSFPAWTLYSPLIFGQHFQHKGEWMNFVGSEVLQTVHLCVWTREAEGNVLGTTRIHKTTSSYIVPEKNNSCFIIPLSIPKGMWNGGPIFNVSFLSKVLLCYVCIDCFFVWFGLYEHKLLQKEVKQFVPQ